VQLRACPGDEWSKVNTANAQKCPELRMNWISRAVAREFGLKSYRGKSVKQEGYGKKKLVSTGKVVDLQCPERSCLHRFYVFKDEDVPFGMLLGAEFVEDGGRKENSV
jgi:hypothetical protein